MDFEHENKKTSDIKKTAKSKDSKGSKGNLPKDPAIDHSKGGKVEHNDKTSFKDEHKKHSESKEVSKNVDQKATKKDLEKLGNEEYKDPTTGYTERRMEEVAAMKDRRAFLKTRR